ncbi:MAG TPA: RHS repeat-associated core domain-containing protein [Nitrospirales bacterium]|nr:RHS repeat-associated core domain-containing protein [Nitrospirales bacterium]
MNQQQPSAGWFRLGAFAMAPGQNHHVEVAGALEGVTVADAIRFVRAGTSAPGIQYVHTDHLGSPQKMTDASKSVVWDAVYTPFGQVHSITGTATNNQRFPGQYFDQETGCHQNWYRDYEPSTGRFVQSDPIGLGGGLNTYVYGMNNSIRFIDPRGLDVWGGAEFTGGVHVGPFGVFMGGGALYNPQTGERCTFVSVCGLGGLGLLVAGGAKGIGFVNGPKCGKNLQGASVGVGVGGEIVAPGAPGVGGNITAGVNVEASGGNLSVDSNGTAGVGVSFGPSFGAGISGGMDGCYTKILGCTNSPSECTDCGKQ